MFATATIENPTRKPDLLLASALAALAVAILLAVSAAVLFERRLAGALVQPLAPGLLICVAALAAAAATATRSLLNRTASNISVTARWLIGASLLLLAIALSLPQSPTIGLTVLWLSVVGAEVQLWRPTSQSAARSRLSPPLKPLTELTTRDDSASDRSAPLVASPGVMQQLIYRRSADRTAAVEGWLRIEFAAGERTVNTHVAFCPAFSGPPHVDAELTGGPECSIRPALVVPWGVRWELKLAEPAATPSFVTLEFLAREREDAAAHRAL